MLIRSSTSAAERFSPRANRTAERSIACDPAASVGTEIATFFRNEHVGPLALVTSLHFVQGGHGVMTAKIAAGKVERRALAAELIVANAPDPVFVSDLKGKILEVNDAVSQL